jgi:hypothetical protein
MVFEGPASSALFIPIFSFLTKIHFTTADIVFTVLVFMVGGLLWGNAMYYLLKPHTKIDVPIS